MASNNRTPATILDAPTLTPVVIHEDHDNPRWFRRSMGIRRPGRNTPYRRPQPKGLTAKQARKAARAS